MSSTVSNEPNMNGKINNENEYFSKASQYWIAVEPTIDGMLGGFSVCDDTDIKGSESFLSQYFLSRDEISKLDDEKAQNQRDKQMRALDLGSGIGRVSKRLLLKFFEKVDLVDQNENFLKEARNYIGSDLYDQRCSVTCSSLHNFEPENGVLYDVLWLQWCSGYLYPDEHLINFLKRSKSMIKPNGLVFLKDNHTNTDEDDLDMQDGSVTRSYTHIVRLVKQSGFKILSEKRQYKMPKGCYPVKMFCLQPLNQDV